MFVWLVEMNLTQIFKKLKSLSSTQDKLKLKGDGHPSPFFVWKNRQKNNGLSRCTLDLLIWRRHPDSNWGMELLQSSALPLGYAASDNINLTIFVPHCQGL